ncbi:MULTISPECIES: peroxiredoxin-like family protein [Curtobacterium]|uniref:peroxiredoxin-like family protein n=1 Tax=Curtobacterium TaxID=2034 RepID=UPI00217D50F3|nr:peroxiredoxin-like family protein [Curtobacterium flaccumfaciens]MCS6562602.1 AhpC/TSA family protein [Curtobacterium flaccumfaciens pv. poinsettiae]UXN28644.1 AhpC/TSA family protein [Curtobacterium flaccumfaciens]
MPQETIARRVDEFNVGFTAQIGPELSTVFDREQADLRAAGVPVAALGEGDSAPDAELLDATGSATSLRQIRGGAPTVLVFYRGAWCPYCNLTLRTYQQELLPALQDRGAQLVAVSPQTPEGTEQAIANGELAFPVLSDPENALAGRFGVVTAPSTEARAAHAQLGFDVADSNADGTAAIPFPSVFVIDEDGVVRFADVHVDYTSRTEVATVLEALDSLDSLDSLEVERTQ